MMNENTNKKIYLASPNDTDIVSLNFWLNDLLEKNNPQTNFVKDPDIADVIILFENFSFKHLDYIKRLEKDDFIKRYAGKIYTINYDDTTFGFLPGCYTGLTRNNFMKNFHIASCYPKEYNQELVEFRKEYQFEFSPNLLFSFRGSAKSHPIRERIFRKIPPNKDWILTRINTAFYAHTELEKNVFLQEILNSHFVLCPRGSSPSTYRMYEAMSLGRCPVIISDDWIPQVGIDWSSCSIRIPESEIQRIPEILKSQLANAKQLGIKSLLTWNSFFSEQKKFSIFLQQILTLADVQPIKNFDSLQQVWHSTSFRRNNKLNLNQRIAQKILSLTNKITELK
ncbi:exostosin family protein [Sphaerospermopsis kisseleviana CS-549]|uniref:Exostosin family protein n=1 Tax=Sphaerospermopsis kisseleviana CS-549 TaxID=3021783 RepID=A0ABT4ZTU0_9CYAN|nr:exostosin family protein [Sphaerospermopsis kisseleviana]MDB9442163.1 exostosin family protein [Sphaerospermopsis kisseleviana CS-549]